MPFQSVPNTVEAVINCTIGSKPAANVLGFSFPGAYSQADLDNLASAIDAWVGADYLPLIAGNVAYNNTHVRGLASIIDLESTDTTSAGNGTAAGDSMPANTSLCVTLRTGLTGRSARGRFYTMPTSIANSLGAQAFTAAYGLAVTGAMSALQTAVSGLPCTWCVISRRTLGAIRPAGVTTPITTAEVRNTLLDSQRGRLAVGH